MQHGLGLALGGERDALRAYVCGLAVLLALTALAYMPVPWASWVYEDAHWINERDFWYIASSYRLVAIVSTLNDWIGGFTPRSYHLFNVALHMVNGALVGVLAGGARRPLAAFTATGLFLLHPLQVESVAYVTGRWELLVALGILVGLLAIRREMPTWTSGLVVAGAGLFALAAKPSGITAPALILLGASTWSAAWLPVTIWAAGFAVALPRLWSVFLNPGVTMPDVSIWSFAFLQITTALQYLGMVFVPVGQTIDHEPGLIGTGMLGLLAWFALFYFRLSARPILWTMGAWILIALAPRFVVLMPEYLNEHQFYVPMIGVSLALGRVVGTHV